MAQSKRIASIDWMRGFVVMLVALYPFCLWYRGYKAAHAESIWLKYL